MKAGLAEPSMYKGLLKQNVPGWRSQIYHENGWVEEMQKHLKNLNLDPKVLGQGPLVNIRFRPSEISNIFDPLVEVPDTDTRISSFRYNLLKIEDTDTEVIQPEIPTSFSFESGIGDSKRLKDRAKRTYQSNQVEIPLVHNQISEGFLDYLQKRYGRENARRECPAAGARSVDIVLKSAKGYTFFEIKTYNNLLYSLRIAVGQLLEYCCYPDVQIAKKIFLVSNLPPEDDHFLDYLRKLNEVLNIPIGYVQFDEQKREVVFQSEEF
ncbi:MAG: hypothetical protein H6566_29690 [Lewinellaceae bacterium]|nr:hypothetical protein [Lewinellaceae bacterium]